MVGIAGDAIYGSLRDVVPATIYLPASELEQELPGRTTVIINVRANVGSPASLIPGVAAALATVDRDLAFSFRSMADQVNASLRQERLAAMLSAFFGVLALLLAGLGLDPASLRTWSHGAVVRSASVWRLAHSVLMSSDSSSGKAFFLHSSAFCVGLQARRLLRVTSRACCLASRRSIRDIHRCGCAVRRSCDCRGCTCRRDARRRLTRWSRFGASESG